MDISGGADTFEISEFLKELNWLYPLRFNAL